MQEEVRDGLARVLADTPVRHGFLDLQLGAATDVGAYVRGELGYRPLERVAAYLFGQATTHAGHSAGAGVRVTF